MRIGMRAPGQNLVTTKTNANCARGFQTADIFLKIIMHRDLGGF